MWDIYHAAQPADFLEQIADLQSWAQAHATGPTLEAILKLCAKADRFLLAFAHPQAYRNNQLSALVQKEIFTFFKCRFTVDVEGPGDLEAEEDFLDHEYTFNRAGQPVTTVSKQWFSWSDTYGVDIAEGEEDILILVSIVVIDMACHADQD